MTTHFSSAVRASVPQNPKLEPSCSSAEAARFLGISVGTVQKLVARNDLQAWRTPGGHRRILLHSLRSYQSKHQLPVQELANALSPDVLHILLVDDDPELKHEMVALAAQTQQRVHCDVLGSGFAALIDMAQIKPDVLMVNMDMPGMDGVALLSSLCEDARFAGMVCVALRHPGSGAPEQVMPLPARVAQVTVPLGADWLEGFVTGLLLTRQKSNRLPI